MRGVLNASTVPRRLGVIWLSPESLLQGHSLDVRALPPDTRFVRACYDDARGQFGIVVESDGMFLTGPGMAIPWCGAGLIPVAVDYDLAPEFTDGRLSGVSLVRKS